MKQLKQKKTVGRKNAEIFCICTLAFMLVQWLVFYVYQNLNSILLSFQKFDPSVEDHVFLKGDALFDNFKRFFKELFLDKRIGRYFLNGMVYHLVGLAALPISLTFAFVIYKKMPASGFFKVMLFMPSIVSGMVVVMLFKFLMLDGFRGFWMDVLKLPYEKFPSLLTSEKYAFRTLILYQFFFALPGSLLINVGTMSRVPKELIEYGKLEGLTLFQEFIHLTLPLMFPVLQVYCLGMFSGFFTASGPVYALYGDGMSTIYTPESVKSFGYYLTVSILSGKAAGGDVRYNYGFTSAVNLTIGLVSIPIIYGTKRLFDKIDPGAEF